jgi:hypothetical protein
MPQMTDWAAMTSELATGAGTLVLAVATFAAVRSANRAARTAEESMRASMRPVLMHSRLADPGQKFAFGDGKWVSVPGGGAAAEATDSAVYLALSVRNAGTGMAILHAWHVGIGQERSLVARPPLEQFTPQTRDMYVASSDVGFWQGALRDPEQDAFAEVAAAVAEHHQVYVDLLYGDFEGGQRVISRFNVIYREPGQLHPDGQAPAGTPAQGRWLASVVRHWNVDRPDPR